MDEDPTLIDAEWLVNRIAHALKNPVFAMSLQVEALALACDDPATATVLSQLDNMNALLEDMLLYGRPARPEPERVRVAPFLEAIVREYSQGSHLPAADLRLLVEPPGLIATWDAAHVRTVLGKVLSNAVEHTPEPHEIVFRASLEGASVLLTVSDNGEGMDGEMLEKAFLPFHPQHGGRPGLGLAISRKLVRAMGGSIGIESRLGQGTTVHIRLPVEAAA